MLVLKEFENKSEAKVFYIEQGLEFNDNSSGLYAKDGEEIIGYCLFDIDATEMNIRAISPQNDLMLLDGIIRSTLHIAASRNIEKAIYSENTPEKILKTLGFVKEQNSLNINKLFENKCSCCKK